MHYIGGGDGLTATDASDGRRPPNRVGGGVLRGARASHNRAGAAVRGDGNEKRQRFLLKAAPYALYRRWGRHGCDRRVGRSPLAHRSVSSS